MKTKRLILGLVCPAIVTVLVMLFANRKSLDTIETPSAGKNTPQLQNISAASLQATAASNTNAAPAQKTIGSTDFSNSFPGNKADQMIGILSTYNDVPIDFYGRLEDQFSNAVAHAVINLSVRVYNGIESTVKRGHVEADANGYFKISGYKGESLGLVPVKEGYALATAVTLFRYSRMEGQHYVPDQNNPTIIKMWKLQGPEPLINISKHYKIPYTNIPMNFDLLTGQIVQSGGDIRIMVNREPGVISGRNRLYWSLQVEAIDGGLMDAAGQDRVAYAAPQSGYQPKMSFIFSTNAPYKWFGGFNQGLFLTSRNGQVYSKLGLSFDINDTPDGFMNIIFSGIANTNGSRNWEGDPNAMNTAR